MAKLWSSRISTSNESNPYRWFGVKERQLELSMLGFQLVSPYKGNAGPRAARLQSLGSLQMLDLIFAIKPTLESRGCSNHQHSHRQTEQVKIKK
jgi:hypothetical protein